jgi:adenylate cyclase
MKLPAALAPVQLIRLAIAFAAVLLTAWPQWQASPGQSWFGDEWLRDQFLRQQASVAPEPRVLVVDIDESSMASLGPWPWPRGRLADLVEILLNDYKARGVALDIVLPRPADAAGDQRLALLASHAPLVLPQAFDYNNTRPEALREGVLAGALPAGSAVPGDAPAATGFIANHAGLAGAPQVGNIGFIPDADGTLRRIALLTTFNGRAYPTLQLALLACCSGQPAPRAVDSALIRIDYRRDWKAYTVVSAADILNQAIDPASAAGRYVVVGSSSLGLADRVTTPLAANRPGLGVQATVLSTLLDRQAGLAAKPWPGRLLAVAFAVLVTALASFALPRLSAIAGTALLGASGIAWLGLAALILPHDELLVTTGPLASLLFLLAVAVPFQWQLAQRRSHSLLHTLRQYVAPSVVQELLRRDLKDPLTPRHLDVTTLIADMEGYTSHVESLPVEEGAELTSTFLACLTAPVIDKQGTLDKYTGDGLVAFWGAPLPQDEHADLALEAARDIVRRVQVLSAQRVAAGFAPLRVRIGIESGPAMAGDFGTSFRSIYTAVGDSVNTASRLEQAARDYPHDVIVGAGTVARARRHQFLLLGERLLRGKEKPATLYTIAPSMDAAVTSNPGATERRA